MLFEKIIGNEKNKKILINSVKNKNILHSYLFYGTEGIGKKIFAMEFAKMILCNNKNSDEPCDECKSCVQFNSNNNPDFFIVEPDGNSIKIEQIRQLQKTMLEKPIESKYKVYIINQSHLMTKEAQNCMLKTLEEPQEYIVIVLIASNENSILPTIKSRCTKIYFSELNDLEINEYVNHKYENITLDKNLIKLCGGSISKADDIANKAEILSKVKAFICNMEKCNKLKFIQNDVLLAENKDDINLILDYINILLFENAMKKRGYIEAMKIVEKTKQKLVNSSNFDMTIDNLLIKIWEEINEKNNRS